MRVRATLDSNILVYGELEPDSAKGERAKALIAETAADGVLAVQALLEFVAVVRRKRPASLNSAASKVGVWSRVFELAPTTPAVAQAALEMSQRHGLQVWDAVIWCAAARAGATVFLSEDLQDGIQIAKMTALNPFKLNDEDFARLICD